MVSSNISEANKVILLAPNCDGTDVGEAWRAFKWCEALSEKVSVVVLAYQRIGRVPVTEQLPRAEVVTWPEPDYFGERFRAMAKPEYGIYYHKVRKWIKAQQAKGRSFYFAHQFTPAALRYPSPLVGLGIPYVLGPHGGSLTTPKGFSSECQGTAWYTKLREIDQWRLKYDPMLKRSFAQAEAVIGVGDYVKDLLQHCNVKRFILHGELTADDLAPLAKHSVPAVGKLKLLHVGRAIRTKGLRDLIRALALLKEYPNITLVSAGDGEDLIHCKSEAKALGVADRITFHGKISRDEVEALYADSDLFAFPSFREPSGRVISEAMRWGLPVLTVNRGGPATAINDSCGFTVPAESPKQLAMDLAQTLMIITVNPAVLIKMRIGARKMIKQYGFWDKKAEWLINIYKQLAMDATSIKKVAS
jgi:glycosyltransferase involved in cell wall biosynthesis